MARSSFSAQCRHRCDFLDVCHVLIDPMMILPSVTVILMASNRCIVRWIRISDQLDEPYFVVEVIMYSEPKNEYLQCTL